MRWLAEHHGLHFDTYDDLWRWSVADLEAFWTSIVEFFEVAVRSTGRAHPGRARRCRARAGSRAPRSTTPRTSSAMLRPTGQRLSTNPRRGRWPSCPGPSSKRRSPRSPPALREMGVNRGDRVVAYMPNMPETVVAFLAAASLGAIWSSCSPDFGVDAVLDRFAQIEPEVLFAIDGYSYGGKPFSQTLRDPAAPAGPADPRAHRPGAPTSRRRADEPRPAATPWDDVDRPPGRRAALRAGPVRSPAVGAVLVRHHRPAQSPGA